MGHSGQSGERLEEDCSQIILVQEKSDELRQQQWYGKEGTASGDT